MARGAAVSSCWNWMRPPGLRNYDVTYAESETSDPYFGKKIAGGHYVSGEASYIEYIGGYYFLFMTYGGLEAAGGYQMRVFRSLSPDGPYVDSKGSSAIYNSYQLNFGLLLMTATAA